MRILVTGGAGFIGSHLCERLLDMDRDVICLDNLVTGRIANLDTIKGHPRFTFERHDLTERLPSLPPVRRIFHLASPASPPGSCETT